MTRQGKQCSHCITGRVQVEIMAAQPAAIARYSRLFAQGVFPSLCQQDDGLFRICHAEAVAPAVALRA